MRTYLTCWNRELSLDKNTGKTDIGWSVICTFFVMTKQYITILISLFIFSYYSFAGLVLPNKEEASKIITQKDEFIRRLDDHNRSLIMKTTTAPSKEEFLDFIEQQTLNWKPTEKLMLGSFYKDIENQLSEMGIKKLLPDKIHIIKTTGREEFYMPYTRGNAIYLPDHLMYSKKSYLFKILAHEIYHIISRNNLEFRFKEYEKIGYFPLGKDVGELVDELLLINPDGLIHGFYTTANSNCSNETCIDGLINVVPILTTEKPSGRPFDLFEAELKLVVLDENFNPTDIIDPFKTNFMSGDNRFKPPFELVHPDEILAYQFEKKIKFNGEDCLHCIPVNLKEDTGIQFVEINGEVTYKGQEKEALSHFKNINNLLHDKINIPKNLILNLSPPGFGGGGGFIVDTARIFQAEYHPVITSHEYGHSILECNAEKASKFWDFHFWCKPGEGPSKCIEKLKKQNHGDSVNVKVVNEILKSQSLLGSQKTIDDWNRFQKSKTAMHELFADLLPSIYFKDGDIVVKSILQTASGDFDPGFETAPAFKRSFTHSHGYQGLDQTRTAYSATGPLRNFIWKTYQEKFPNDPSALVKIVIDIFVNDYEERSQDHKKWNLTWSNLNRRLIGKIQQKLGTLGV